MKKKNTYLAPSLELINIDTIRLLNDSGKTESGGEIGHGDEQGAKPNDFFNPNADVDEVSSNYSAWDDEL